MVSSFVFDRDNRGLLTPALAPEEAAASLATETPVEECDSTCGHEPTKVRHDRQEGRGVKRRRERKSLLLRITMMLMP